MYENVACMLCVGMGPSIIYSIVLNFTMALVCSHKLKHFMTWEGRKLPPATGWSSIIIPKIIVSLNSSSVLNSYIHFNIPSNQRLFRCQHINILGIWFNKIS